MFIFAHIEKCGGTTLNEMLKYNILSYVMLRSWHKFPGDISTDFTEKDLKRFTYYYPFLKGVGGHTIRPYFDYSRAFTKKKEIKIFTFLRDPLDRYLSHYNHVVERSVKRIDIKHFMNVEVHNNYIVKRLSGSENLDKAKRVLNKLDFVGSQQYYNESLLLLNKMIFNGSLDVRYEKKNIGILNRSSKKNKFSENQISLIIDKNKLDIELYRYYLESIRPKFLHHISDYEVRVFEKQNENYKYDSRRVFLIKILRAYEKIILENFARMIKI